MGGLFADGRDRGTKLLRVMVTKMRSTGMQCGGAPTDQRWLKAGEFERDSLRIKILSRVRMQISVSFRTIFLFLRKRFLERSKPNILRYFADRQVICEDHPQLSLTGSLVVFSVSDSIIHSIGKIVGAKFSSIYLWSNIVSC